MVDSRVERREAGEEEQFLIDYAFGSGRTRDHIRHTDRPHAWPTRRCSTPADRIRPQRGTGHHPGVKDRPAVPSMQREVGTASYYPTPATLKRFECHTTTMSDRGTQPRDETVMTPNVGCERCHGPGWSHIE